MKVLLAIIWNTFILGTIGIIPISLLLRLLAFLSLTSSNLYLELLNLEQWLASLLSRLPADLIPLVSHFFIVFLIVITISGMMATRLGTFIMKIPMAIRRPSQREINILNPLLTNIINKVKLKYGKDLKCKLLIADELLVQAAVIGRNTLVITKGTFKNATEQELQSIMAHEVGHIFYGDSMRLSLVLGADLCGTLAIRAYGLVIKFFMALCEICSSIPIFGIPFAVAVLILSMFVFPVILIDKLQLLIFSWITRKEEYRADQFAAKLGLGKGLATFLSKEAEQEIRTDGFWKKYNRSHPPTELRVDKIESFMSKNVLPN